MNFIDTHTHLYLPEFDEDRDMMIGRAKSVGVDKMYLPNIDHTSVESMLQLEKQYPDFCFAMMGLHPCSVKENVKEELNLVEKWLQQRTFIGIGEIGLDYYWDISFKDDQLAALRQQLTWAREVHLPVSIHSRNATADCIKEAAALQDGNLSGVFHCFSGSAEEAKQIIDLGFYLGIGGVVTFKNGGLDKVLADVPLHHLVLETDAPYLAPVPYRGKRNESAYIPLIAEKLARVYQTTTEEVAQITTTNATKIFVMKNL
jgi:TatD DNase family protein